MATDFTQDTLLHFLQSSGGQVKNSDLILHFRNFIRDHEDRTRNRELFKKFVNSVATVRQIDGVSYVVLRKKFKGHVGSGSGGEPGSVEPSTGRNAEPSPEKVKHSPAGSAEKPRQKLPQQREVTAPAAAGGTAGKTILPAAGIMLLNNNNMETNLNLKRKQVSSTPELPGRPAAAAAQVVSQTPSLSEPAAPDQSTKVGQHRVVHPADRPHGETRQQVQVPETLRGREAGLQSLHQEPPLHHQAQGAPRRIRPNGETSQNVPVPEPLRGREARLQPAEGGLQQESPLHHASLQAQGAPRHIRPNGETSQQVPVPEPLRGREARLQPAELQSLHQEPPLHHASLQAQGAPRHIRPHGETSQKVPVPEPLRGREAPLQSLHQEPPLHQVPPLHHASLQAQGAPRHIRPHGETSQQVPVREPLRGREAPLQSLHQEPPLHHQAQRAPRRIRHRPSYKTAVSYDEYEEEEEDEVQLRRGSTGGAWPLSTPLGDMGRAISASSPCIIDQPVVVSSASSLRIVDQPVASSLRIVDQPVVSSASSLRIVDQPVVSSASSLRIVDQPVVSSASSLCIVDQPVVSSLRIVDQPVVSSASSLRIVDQPVVSSASSLCIVDQPVVSSVSSSSSSSVMKLPQIYVQDVEGKTLPSGGGPGWRSESGAGQRGQWAGPGLEPGTVPPGESTRRSLPLEAERYLPSSPKRATEAAPHRDVHADRRYSQPAGVQLDHRQGLNQSQALSSSLSSSTVPPSSDVGLSSGNCPPPSSSRGSGWNSRYEELQTRAGRTGSGSQIQEVLGRAEGKKLESVMHQADSKTTTPWHHSAGNLHDDQEPSDRLSPLHRSNDHLHVDRSSAARVMPWHLSTGDLYDDREETESSDGSTSSPPLRTRPPVARRLSSQLRNRMCRSLGADLDQILQEGEGAGGGSEAARLNRLHMISSSLSLRYNLSSSSLSSCSTPTRCRSFTDLNEGVEGRTSFPTTASSPAHHEGSSRQSLVPLEPREHAWLVKGAAGAWPDIYTLFREDSSLLNRQDFISGFTVLHWIAKHGDHRVLNTLWYGVQKAGMTLDVNAKSTCGHTPLHIAAMHGNKNMMRLLVSKFNADVTLRDTAGKKPWQYLSRTWPPDVFELLGAPPRFTGKGEEGVGGEDPDLEERKPHRRRRRHHLSFASSGDRPLTMSGTTRVKRSSSIAAFLKHKSLLRFHGHQSDSSF